MTDEYDYPELPDDDLLAFVQLEAEFRQTYYLTSDELDNNGNVDAAEYMNNVMAAASTLGIPGLPKPPIAAPDSVSFNRELQQFFLSVDRVLIRIRINQTRRSRAQSVGLSEEQKTKIHALIEEIRGAVAESAATEPKKDKLFDILTALAKEVSKSRAALARFGDLARGLAGISKDVAEEGAEPWWKFAKLIWLEVDDAKDAEPKLPKPKEVKRIEPPKKKLLKPPSDIDDESPL